MRLDVIAEVVLIAATFAGLPALALRLLHKALP